MQLKVKDNLVVGVEPWYEFPFNKGMMCPKGIKRYLQQAHPDRLLHAYEKDPGSPGGFRTMAYDAAIRQTAAEIDRIQRAYGNDAFAILSGASLTTEKTYLMGKFAHMCLRTANIDYNGRLCMVSAGAGNKKAFGIDRAANPWSDILGADVIWSAAPTSPNARPSPRTMSGRPASRAPRSSSWIRASRRSRGPAICSCRSSRDATRRSSTASCT